MSLSLTIPAFRFKVQNSQQRGDNLLNDFQDLLFPIQLFFWNKLTIEALAVLKLYLSSIESKLHGIAEITLAQR